jgi:hypothetical protein
MPGSTISSRVPAALQQIFVASQQGEDVQKISAPTDGMGFKMFRRGWGKKQKKQKVVRAPTTSSLNSERSGSRDTAADASIKAIKNKNAKTIVSAHSFHRIGGRFREKSLFSPLLTPYFPYFLLQIDSQSPQAYLDKQIEARGYSVKKYLSLEGGYYCRPTPLQQASYGSRISFAVRSSEVSLVRRLLDAGLSPNPCNNYGESLVHMVCRRGDHKLLKVLLEAGCSLQVTDDYGRTPLHDACWRADPSFETVQLILDSDTHLLQLLDCRGAAPLSYVKKENYPIWIEFLEAKLDRFWPIRDIRTEGEEHPPPLTVRSPHAIPIPDPVHALPLEVAAMVANGRMEPEEAIYLDDEDDSESDSDSEFDSDDDSDDGSQSSMSSDGTDFDQEEFAEICLRAGGPMAIANKCFRGNVQVVGGIPRKMA